MTVPGGAGSAEPTCGFFPALYDLKRLAAVFLTIRVAPEAYHFER
jgi:hypothetical protein